MMLGYTTIAFLITTLNELEINSIDIGNAYLNAPAREKVYTTAGPEFGPDKVGRPVIIERALYGLKTSGAAWHSQLTETLRSMDFALSLADPDVWLRPASKENGLESASEPKTYLGAFIKQWHIKGDGRKIWSMSSSHYINEALSALE